MRRFVPTFFCLALLAVLPAVRAHADTVTIPDVSTLQTAIDNAVGARTIEIQTGTSALAGNIDVNKPNITIQGQGVLATKIQVSGTGYRFSVTGAGCTIRNLDLEKTDKTTGQDIIWINADNVTVRDNRIHGQFVIGDGEVARAMVISAGLSNMLITGNEIFALRQPAYMSGSLTPSPAGTISSNFVHGTKGWVIEGGNMVFSGNTWGTGANANVNDISILASAQPGFYTDIVAMSNANNAAVIEDQRPSPAVLSIVAVNAAAAPGGNGGPLAPYQTISPAVPRVVAGGTINVAAGSYAEDIAITRKLLLVGAGDGSNPATNTILVAGAGNGIDFQAGGTSASDRCVVRDLRVSGGSAGLFTDSAIGHVTLQNLTVTGATNYGFEIHNSAVVSDLVMTDVDLVNGLSTGMRVRGTLDGLVMTNGHIDGEAFGLQSYQAGSSDDGTRFRNVTVTGTTFNNNTSKGMYFEKLSDALFDGVTVSNSGTVGANAAGVDINLKFAAYQNVEIRNSTISGCGTGDPVAGFGVGVKARDDGGTYGPHPATLTNVDLDGNTFTGCQNAIRLGELAKNNAGPTVVDIHSNSITGSLSKGLDNETQATPDATCNWWGNVLGPNTPSNPSPGDGVTGAALYLPSWTSATGPCNGYGANYVAANTAGLCLSNAHPCVTVPVNFVRADASLARGVSVTVHLGAGLQLCDLAHVAANFHQGGWLAGFGTTYQVVDNGGGTYTIDQAVLGSPCGVAGGGLLFSVDVQKVPATPDGSGTITVTAVAARDCSNAPLAGFPGGPASLGIDFSLPAAMGDLAAVQQKTGNSHSIGTTNLTLTFTAPGDAATVQVYRAPFGGGTAGSYPEFTGSAPSAPAYPPAAPWVLTPVAASGGVDNPGTRGFWYYVAFSTDACGNTSPVSNVTAGKLDYFLGDVANGVTPCAGNNVVDGLDIAELGLHYGTTPGPGDTYACLDVGPTTNGSVDARPAPDDRIGFDDMMMYAINYGQVSAPMTVAAMAPADRDELALDAPAKVAAGSTFTVSLRFKGTGGLQGVSTQLGWDRNVAEPVSVTAGDLIASQNGIVFSARDGNADAAVLGAGRGISGEGVLATLTFRAKAAGDPLLKIVSADARDTQNRTVALDGSRPAAPTASGLMPAMPNPFTATTALAFSLARAGRADLSVYSVDGRRVRVLASGTREAGQYRLTWDGTDEGGQAVKAGMYFIRLNTADGHFNRTLVLTR